jgi:hypothetical protein
VEEEERERAERRTESPSLVEATCTCAAHEEGKFGPAAGPEKVDFFGAC